MDWLPVETVTPPTGALFTTAEARAQVRVLHDAEDALIDRLVAAASSAVERRTGTRLLPQVVVLRADCLAETMALPVAPVRAITEIEYVDADGAVQTLDPALYVEHLHGLAPRIARAPGASWPETQARADAVRITAAAGYASAAAVDDDIGHAVLLLAGHWYQNREAVVTGTIATPLPLGVEMLIGSHRVFGF